MESKRQPPSTLIATLALNGENILLNILILRLGFDKYANWIRIFYAHDWFCVGFFYLMHVNDYFCLFVLFAFTSALNQCIRIICSIFKRILKNFLGRGVSPDGWRNCGTSYLKKFLCKSGPLCGQNTEEAKFQEGKMWQNYPPHGQTFLRGPC